MGGTPCTNATLDRNSEPPFPLTLYVQTLLMIKYVSKSPLVCFAGFPKGELLALYLVSQLNNIRKVVSFLLLLSEDLFQLGDGLVPGLRYTQHSEHHGDQQDAGVKEEDVLDPNN